MSKNVLNNIETTHSGRGILTTSTIPENIEDLIDQEKKALAKEYFSDIWSDIQAENLGTELIVEVFIQEAIERLANEKGLEQASKLISHFKNMDELGTLPVQRTLQ